MKNLIPITAIFLLNSCGTISERNIYDGIKSQQIIKDVSNSEKKQTLPTYEKYKEEREKQLKNKLY